MSSVGDAEANKMFTRAYRAPFVVPAKVRETGRAWRASSEAREEGRTLARLRRAAGSIWRARGNGGVA